MAGTGCRIAWGSSRTQRLPALVKNVGTMAGEAWWAAGLQGTGTKSESRGGTAGDSRPQVLHFFRVCKRKLYALFAIDFTGENFRS